jgi:hypothetical protein
VITTLDSMSAGGFEPLDLALLASSILATVFLTVR